MARNFEKNYSQLNRWYLQKQSEKTKKEKRPPLGLVNSPAELKMDSYNKK